MVQVETQPQTQEDITFPYLIYRNENEVQWDIGKLEDARKELCNEANSLRDDFLDFIGKFTLESLIQFLEMDEVTAQKWLLDPQMKQAAKIGIKEAKRLEFIKENFDLPAHGHLLTHHRYFSKRMDDLRAMYDGTTKTFKQILVNKEERERIEHKHSKYAHNKKEYDWYIAVKKLFEANEYLTLSGDIYHPDQLSNIISKYGKNYVLPYRTFHKRDVRRLDFDKI